MSEIKPLTEASNEALLAELQRRASESPQLRQQALEALAGGDVRPDVKRTLSGSDKAAPEKSEKRELTPEAADALIQTIKSRFASSDKKLRKAIDFADFEKSLRADSEALFSLQKLEETGGKSQLVRLDGDEFVLEDRSAESPSGRRDRDFDQADEQRKSFGPKVRFQGTDSYKAMQKTGEYDLNSGSWLETDAKTRKADGALVGRRDGVGVRVVEVNADVSIPRLGWRASLRVKKA